MKETQTPTAYERLLQVDWEAVKEKKLETLARKHIEPIAAMEDPDEQALYLEKKAAIFQKFVKMIEEAFPEAWPESPDSPKESIASTQDADQKEKPASSTQSPTPQEGVDDPPPKASKPKTPKKPTKEELEATKKELEECILALKQFNKQVEDSKPPKREKTRYEKLLERCLAVLRLAPEKVALQPEYQAKVASLVEAFIDDLMDLWEMKRNKSDQRRHKKIMGAYEDQQAEKTRKELAKQFREELPGLEDLMGIVTVADDAKKEAAREAKEKLSEAIKKFEQDPKAAQQFLTKAFERSQLERIVPKAFYEHLFKAA